MPGKVQESKAARRRRLAKEKKAATKEGPVRFSPLFKNSDELTVIFQNGVSVTPEPEADGGLRSESEARSEPLTNSEDKEDFTKEDSAKREYPSSFFTVDPDDPLYQSFKNVLERPGLQGTETKVETVKPKPEVYFEEDDIPEEEDEDAEKAKLSKKAKKAAHKLSIAELKAITTHPELVEWTDVSAADPRILLALKGTRNVVPVPNHWSLKREYLSSKRGIEKPQFTLPKFLVDTGITEMRDTLLEKQAEQTLKQKMRERVNPKIGKMEIDYQKLWEAFFRLQTKPEMTRFGEIYYEGKEFETNLKHLRPGELSDELKDALGMPPAAPPPWLINQQRIGLPPSYPALRIPGLNAPPPPGGSWGFHPGGWGKPPVDEAGNPLYGGSIGDVYGVSQQQQAAPPAGEPIERTLWGELVPPEEESDDESEEEDDEEDEDENADQTDIPGGIQTPIDPSGIASAVPSEFNIPDRGDQDFSLRKDRRSGIDTEDHPSRTAYTIVKEQAARNQGFFGSERTYDIRGAQQNANVPILGQEDRSRKRKAGDVDVSVDVDALAREDKLSKDEIRKQYESGRQAEQQWQGGLDQDELGAMIAEESRKRQKKDQEAKRRR
jgi:splicing factor 3B subunit 2